jgi:N6-adenosine-specific RNA methylase IME4
MKDAAGRPRPSGIKTTITLARYDAACRALADAKSVDEAKRIRDVADAMRAYAKQAKNRQLEIDAAEIRMRAERRVGELILRQKATVGDRLAQGRRTDLVPRRNQVERVTLIEAGIDKKLSSRAQKLAALPAPMFEGILEKWRARLTTETERVTTNLLYESGREQARAARPPRPLPVGRYRLLYADPPWRYDHTEANSRAIENQYPTMTLEEICRLPIPAADDAVLFLWASSPKLADAIRVMDAWGLSYRTCAVWDKEVTGMGYYFRQQHELLLVGARGHLPVPDAARRPPSMIRTKRSRVHSEKPSAVYDLLEKMYPHFGPRERVELFARTARPGWTAWSNEPALQTR